MKLRQIMVGMALLGASLGVFQNCSDVQYSSLSSDSDVYKMAGIDDSNFVVESPISASSALSSTVESNSFRCHKNNLEDIQVNIKEVTLGLDTAKSVSGQQSLIELSRGLVLRVDQSQKAAFVRLVLAETGHSLVGKDGQTYELKTPSTQTSGLKIPLSGQDLFKGGQDYLVQFDLDPDTQIVQAGSRCILKPVFKAVHVVPVQANDNL